MSYMQGQGDIVLAASEKFESERRLLSRDRKSSEQFTCFNHRDHEMKAELALSRIVPSMRSDANQEEAI
jgi:hypothetical protein